MPSDPFRTFSKESNPTQCTHISIPLARPAAASTLPLVRTGAQQLEGKQLRLFATAVPPSPSDGSEGGSGSKPWQVNLLYDSDCPLCMKEVDFLRKRDVDGAFLGGWELGW